MICDRNHAPSGDQSTSALRPNSANRIGAFAERCSQSWWSWSAFASRHSTAVAERGPAHEWKAREIASRAPENYSESDSDDHRTPLRRPNGHADQLRGTAATCCVAPGHPPPEAYHARRSTRWLVSCIRLLDGTSLLSQCLSPTYKREDTRAPEQQGRTYEHTNGGWALDEGEDSGIFKARTTANGEPLNNRTDDVRYAREQKIETEYRDGSAEEVVSPEVTKAGDTSRSLHQGRPPARHQDETQNEQCVARGSKERVPR